MIFHRCRGWRVTGHSIASGLDGRWPIIGIVRSGIEVSKDYTHRKFIGLGYEVGAAQKRRELDEYMRDR